MRALPHAHPATVAVSAAVIVTVLALRRASRRVPGALIAVTGAIIVSRVADLARHGVAVLGAVPRGLPHLGLPALGYHDATLLLGTAASMFVVILAQSAATSRAYAVKYEDPFSEDTDLTGLAAANVAAAFSGTFVVNGSPTKTQIADSAGGRSQLTCLTTAAVVLVVLLLLTGPLASLPAAALAAVVFLIAVDLIDVTGMRRILAVRRHEFAVALLTAAAAAVLARTIKQLHQQHIHVAVGSLLGPVRQQLDRYGISTALGPGTYYDTPGEALEAFQATAGPDSPPRRAVLDAVHRPPHSPTRWILGGHVRICRHV